MLLVIKMWQKSAQGSDAAITTEKPTLYCDKHNIGWVKIKSWFYQITTLLEGARYMPSVFLTPKAAYHSGKFLGGILARR